MYPLFKQPVSLQPLRYNFNAVAALLMAPVVKAVNYSVSVTLSLFQLSGGLKGDLTVKDLHLP